MRPQLNTVNYSHHKLNFFELAVLYQCHNTPHTQSTTVHLESWRARAAVQFCEVENLRILLSFKLQSSRWCFAVTEWQEQQQVDAAKMWKHLHKLFFTTCYSQLRKQRAFVQGPADFGTENVALVKIMSHNIIFCVKLEVSKKINHPNTSSSKNKLHTTKTVRGLTIDWSMRHQAGHGNFKRWIIYRREKWFSSGAPAPSK